jgi:hypothetical protein
MVAAAVAGLAARQSGLANCHAFIALTIISGVVHSVHIDSDQ